MILFDMKTLFSYYIYEEWGHNDDSKNTRST